MHRIHIRMYAKMLTHMQKHKVHTHTHNTVATCFDATDALMDITLLIDMH